MEAEGQMPLHLVPVVEKPPQDMHMAIDVSTLSKNPDAVIASLAWLVFNPKDTGGAWDTYMRTVDWDQRERAYNWATVQEWMLKSGMARRAIVNFTTPVPLLSAITSVVEAFNKHKCSAIWGTRSALNTVENAIRYCKKEAPWTAAQARDLTACWAVSSDLGQVADLERHQTEVEDVPLGNAAFVARAVRQIYQAKGGPDSPDAKVA